MEKKKQSNIKTSILNAAQDLMLDKGYVATSIDQICKKASTTKGSFFHYFNNKEALGIELVQRFSDVNLDFFHSEFLKIKDDDEKIFAIVDQFVALSQRTEFKGCLIGTFSQELSNTYPDIRKVCESFFDRLAKLVKDNLEVLNEKRLKGKQINIDGLVNCLISVIQGSIIMMKAKCDKNIMENNLLEFKRYIKLVLETDKKTALSR